MKNLLALIGLLVVGAGGAGWYLGWYKVKVSNGPDGNLRVETDVNTRQAADDLSRLGKRIGDAVSDKGDHGGAPAQTGAPGNTPGPLSTPKDAAPAATTPQPVVGPPREGGFFSTIGKLIDDRAK